MLRRDPLLLATCLFPLLACGPAAAPPPVRPAPASLAAASQGATVPASRPVPWLTERCRGPLPGVASTPPATQPAAPPLAADEAATRREHGLLLEPGRLRHFILARGGRIELHRKPTPNGNGKARNGGKKNGPRDHEPGPGVVCVPIAEADLLALPGCERVHLCAEPGAYALVVESGGRPVMARGATVSLAGFTVRVEPAPEAGHQLVWQVTERGLDAAHEVQREEVLRPQGLRLRQVFGRVVASSLHESAAPRGAAPASRPAGCRVEPLAVSCGDDRYVWDAEAFEYRLALPAGLVPYKPHEVATGPVDPVRALYAALHASASARVAFQRRGFECVEAQVGYELWSRWPVREGRAPKAGEVWRVAVAPGRVAVEILPYLPDDDGQPRVRGVRPEHDYARERAFLAALKEALARQVDAPPKGLEGFRCGAGFGQPIADVSLGAAAEKVRTREQRWRRKCDKTPAQVKKAAAAAGGKVRFTCERDGVARTYDFAANALVTVTERYPAEFAPRHLRRATERWIARFGNPTAATDDVSRWRWHDRELAATKLPDGAALFEHKLVPSPATKPAPAPVAQTCRSKHDCPYSQACVGGRCGACRDQRDCRGDSLCRDGRCVQGPM